MKLVHIFTANSMQYNNFVGYISIFFLMKSFTYCVGPWFINRVRPDISKKYSSALNDPNLIPEYIYQCNCQHPR